MHEGGSSRNGSSSRNGPLNSNGSASSSSDAGPLMRELASENQAFRSELELIKSRTVSTPSLAELQALVISKVKIAVRDEVNVIKTQFAAAVEDKVHAIAKRVEDHQDKLKKYDEWHDNMRGHFDGQLASMNSKMDKQHQALAESAQKM